MRHIDALLYHSSTNIVTELTVRPFSRMNYVEHASLVFKISIVFTPTCIKVIIDLLITHFKENSKFKYTEWKIGGGKGLYIA